LEEFVAGPDGGSVVTPFHGNVFCETYDAWGWEIAETLSFISDFNDGYFSVQHRDGVLDGDALKWFVSCVENEN
jgi:hypothetical protein